MSIEHTPAPRLTGRPALVTGASCGIRADDDASLPITSHNLAGRAEEVVDGPRGQSSDALVIRAGVSGPGAVVSLVSAGAERLGWLDILTSSTGVVLARPLTTQRTNVRAGE